MTLHDPPRPTGPTLLEAFLARRVVQWGFGYVAGSWILLEFLDFLTELYGWPDVAVRVALTLLGFGLAAVLVLAWYHGEKGRQEFTRREVALLAVIGVSGVLTAAWVGVGASGGERPGLVPTAAARTVLDDPRRAAASLAVLPFANLGDAAEDYFADGVTEDIIAQLSRIPNLRVISRTSVMQYRGTLRSIPEIGRELGVEYILEGSARRVGPRVRIVAQLIDARTDEHLWSETFDRDLSDILRVQAEVAERIAANLSRLLGLAEPPRFAAAAGPVESEAYSLYVRGRRLIRSPDPEAREEGGRLLEEAVTREPALQAAVAELADAVLREVDEGAGAAPLPGAERIREFVGRHAGRTWQVALARGDREAARAALVEALRADPNNSEARRWYGLLLLQEGETEEGLEQLRISRSLDPLSPAPALDLAEAMVAAGQTAEGLRELERWVERRPDHVSTRVALGMAYLAAGEEERAAAEIARAREGAPSHPSAMGAHGYLLAREGRTDEARSLLDSLEADPRGGAAHRVARAQILAGLGDTAEARRLLEDSPEGTLGRVLSGRGTHVIPVRPRPPQSPR